ncbi:MAG: acylphosphatase [Actinobacteria bacterium]|nr:acylphosphatase [Actinomycetota bacterium]
MIAVHFVVRGRVQGVAYRWSARQAAERLGVAGWVRNRPDGCVEGWAEGPQGPIEGFTEWLQEGPRAARVDAVELDPGVPGGLEGFEIRG